MSTPPDALPPLIDSHAHLNFPDAFGADLDEVLARARAAGVERVICIGTSVASSQRAQAMAHAHDMVFASAGIHPHQVDEFDDADWPALTALWADPRVRAVGETGLDDFYDHGDRDRQRVLYRRHLEAAGEVGKPVVVHIRDAFDDAFALTAEVGLPAGGVVHCFTGGQRELDRALALGFDISLSGIATFKSAKALRAAIPHIPLDRLHVETDAPYLAPVPHRGQRCEPAFVADTAAAIAALRGEPVATLRAASRANTCRLFGLP